MTLVGLSGSLRGKITSELAPILERDLGLIEDKESLRAYLRLNSELPAEETLADLALPEELFELYHEQRRRKHRRGISNSEAALAAALWAAGKKGVAVVYRGLGEYFTPDGRRERLDELQEVLRGAEAVMVSGPVYFGDRSSLVQDFIAMIRDDATLKESLAGKLYGGITVGAKRNGGQETALIYQVLDMTAAGFLAVGNDSDTTSQYGGTVHAGNVGAMHKDDYGLNTALGTGRRLANLLLRYQGSKSLADKVRVAFVVLQDGRGIARKQVQALTEAFGDRMEAEVIDVSGLDIRRCMACDSCPAKVGPDEDYRCAVGKADDFISIHGRLLDHDAIVPITVSLHERGDVRSNYQVFMERTRYLRRGDYALSDNMLSPLVLEEPGAGENLHVRSITSLIRHHTVVSKPLVGILDGDGLVNQDRVQEDFSAFLAATGKLAAARLTSALSGNGSTRYNPVGYVLNADKAKEGKRLMERRFAVAKRRERLLALARQRLEE